MIIDDDRLDQLLYRRIIDRSGLVDKIIPLQMAEDALAYLKLKDRENIDVIFLDINIPRMNGFEFLEQATREFGPDFSKHVVIMLTTSLDPDDLERARQFDVVKAYQGKPLTLDGLKDIARMIAEPATQALGHPTESE